MKKKFTILALAGVLFAGVAKAQDPDAYNHGMDFRNPRREMVRDHREMMQNRRDIMRDRRDFRRDRRECR
jgi:hypothetical protein